MNKEMLIKEIVDSLKGELNNTLEAAKNAHLAAIDDQSVAETQYDTLAIEAGYLAEGQTRRVQEIRQALAKYEVLKLMSFDEKSPIALSALVQLSKDAAENHWFFIGPAAGGFRTKIDEKHYTVITPQSPMGQAMLGKYLEDDVIISFGHGAHVETLTDYISSCY